MPDVLWGGLQVDQDPVTSTQTGSQPGPGGGDGWTIVGRLPKSKLLTNRAYVFVVSGTVCNIQRVGAPAQRGLCQVALGDPSGVIHPDYCMELAVEWPTTATDGQPFQFLVIFDPGYGIADPVWGSRWPNLEDLCLYGRCYTNGDQQNYAATFDVAGVSWLWFDIDVIDGSRHFVDQHWPASPIQQVQAGGYQDRYLGPSMPGTAGEKWVHFVNLSFTPLDPYVSIYVQHGSTDISPSMAGFAPKVGGRVWGCAARGSSGAGTLRFPRMHFGSFCNQTRPSGNLYWGYRSNGECLIYRWRHFAIRLDELPELSMLSLGSLASDPPDHDPIGFVHEPPPQTGQVMQPIYLASVRPHSHAPGLLSYQLHLATRSGRVLFDQVINKLPVEGVPMFGAAELGLGRGDGVRYEHQLLQSPIAAQFYADDIELLQVWLLKDPTIQPQDPYPELEPVYVVPSREGAALVSQSALPIQPAEGIQMEPERPEAEILGVTGVRRRWPLFSSPRRSWSLSWPALRDAEMQTLDAFLRANPTFRWRPPQESADLVVLALAEPAFEMLDSANWTWSLQMQVIELVFTGGS